MDLFSNSRLIFIKEIFFIPDSLRKGIFELIYKAYFLGALFNVLAVKELGY